jgi:hypothetical protein
MTTTDDIMTQFTKAWVVRSDSPAAVGATVSVNLKSGATKDIVVAAIAPQSDGTYLIIPAGR